MIELRNIDGLICPVVVCDRCGADIKSRAANVEWLEDLSAWRIVHKAPDCDAIAEQPGAQREWPMWEELDRWLTHLLWNTGYKDVDLDLGK